MVWWWKNKVNVECSFLFFLFDSHCRLLSPFLILFSLSTCLPKTSKMAAIIPQAKPGSLWLSRGLRVGSKTIARREPRWQLRLTQNNPQIASRNHSVKHTTGVWPPWELAVHAALACLSHRVFTYLCVDTSLLKKYKTTLSAHYRSQATFTAVTATGFVPTTSSCFRSSICDEAASRRKLASFHHKREKRVYIKQTNKQITLHRVFTPDTPNFWRVGLFRKDYV